MVEIDPLLKEIYIDNLCGKITNEMLRDNVKKYFIEEVGNWFWSAPAAKNNHPWDEREEGGLILHTQRVISMSAWLANAEKLSEWDKNILICGAAVHDTKKAEYHGNKFMKYNVNHADLLDGSCLRKEIVNIVKLHMGPWYKEERWTNNKKECELGRLLYYADYITSRKEFTLTDF